MNAVSRISAFALSGLALGAAGSLAVNLTTPKTPVEVDYQGPVLEEVVVGYIPSDYYVKGSRRPSPELERQASRAIWAQSPVLDAQGQPKIVEQRARFEGRGTPELTWTSTPVTRPEFRGSFVRLDEDTSSTPIFMPGPDGTTTTTWIYNTDGYHVRYSPDVAQVPLGTISYRKPSVRYQPPSNTLTWAGIGAGVGLSAGLVGVALGGGRDDW